MRTRVAKERRPKTAARTSVRAGGGAAAGAGLLSADVLTNALGADAANDDVRAPEAAPVEAAPVDDDDDDDDEPESADASEAPAERSEERSETPSNFLSMYFREMARLAVLRPQEEFESARRLEALEIALWAQLLSYPPMTEHVMKVCEHVLSEEPARGEDDEAEGGTRGERPRAIAELRSLRRVLGDKRRVERRDRERFDRAVLRTAEKLRVLDSDRLAVEAAMRELRTVARGGAGRLIDDKLAMAPQGKPYRDYLAAVAGAFMRVQRAKNDFVSANLRLVVSIARRFNFGRMPLADLIQEGNIGLIKAVERFDHRRGYRFSTYASWWIRHAISRALADKGRAVRLPVHMIDAYHRLGKARRELQNTLGRPATTDELAHKTGIPAAKLEKMKTFLTDQSFSLDRPVNDEDGRRFIDFLQDPNDEGVTTDDHLVGETMSTEVRAELLHLRPIEADILRQRFGFDTDEELTLKQIGEKYNLSRERIRQLQEQALEKMRRALQRKDLM